MMAPPHLPVVTEEQFDAAMEVLKEVKIHRKQDKACGWSSLIQAYTMGEIWFWYVNDTEAATIVPLVGYPYTRREEAFHAYLEAFDHH